MLVIDDEPDIRTYLKMIFRDQGAEVIEAHDANRGFRQIRDGKPDLVTLDLIMPHKTGEKLYWELRKDQNYKDLPIMIITGYARQDKPTINFQEFIQEKGIPEPDAFLEKPIDPVAVIDTAIQVLAPKIPLKEVTDVRRRSAAPRETGSQRAFVWPSLRRGSVLHLDSGSGSAGAGG